MKMRTNEATSKWSVDPTQFAELDLLQEATEPNSLRRRPAEESDDDEIPMWHHSWGM
jgi:hypothetical protein